MKKIIAAALCALLLTLTLTGCLPSFGKEKTALTVSGTPVGEKIYNFYYDRVSQRPGDYGLEENAGKGKIKDAAVEQCVRYVAMNTYFAELGLSLSVSEKVSVADNVNNFWLRSAEHFKKIGTDKPALTKIFTSEAYEDAIFSYLYDKGTGDAAAEQYVTAYFYSNYVAFRNICAYYTSDDGSSRITEQERLALVNTFAGIAAASGTDSDSFNAACSDAGYMASDTVVLDRNAAGYPDGFFEGVNMMEADTVKTFEYDDCIFAVRKESLMNLGDSLYAAYRDECIRAMHESEWNENIQSVIARFSVDSVNV